MANTSSFEKETSERLDLDLSRCIICQEVKTIVLFENPNSHERVVTSIKEWATYGDTCYSQTWSKMKSVSIDDLKNKQASWHRNCYRDAVHTGMLKRTKERYERQLEGPNEARRKSRDITQEPSQLTCSKISPFNRGARFFCEGHPGYQETLHSISTFPAGESLLAAVELCGNDELHMKLSTAVDASDAHAIDLKSTTRSVGPAMLCMYQVSRRCLLLSLPLVCQVRSQPK